MLANPLACNLIITDMKCKPIVGTIKSKNVNNED